MKLHKIRQNVPEPDGFGPASPEARDLSGSENFYQHVNFFWGRIRNSPSLFVNQQYVEKKEVEAISFPIGRLAGVGVLQRQDFVVESPRCLGFCKGWIICFSQKNKFRGIFFLSFFAPSLQWKEAAIVGLKNPLFNRIRPCWQSSESSS